ncbi:MAG: tetratricopeptide repeat protein [Paludibacteraceae bacterium]|nr:tetratricopeptide repeat protein [Paludibacteraceae bacterium]
MAKQVNTEEKTELQEAISASGQWIIKNQNLLMWCLCGILAVIVAVMAFNNYYLTPKNQEAADAVGKAVVYFANDNYEAALNGMDDQFMGFEEIADTYGITKSGKLAAVYAGICHYNLGNYEEAVHYLGKYNADDLNIAPAVMMKKGDAYAEMGETQKAASCFMKAGKADNAVIAPIALKKAGIAYTAMGDTKAARKAYETIKEKYPQSQEAQDIDKYILSAK